MISGFGARATCYIRSIVSVEQKIVYYSSSMNDLGISSGNEALAVLKKLVRNGHVTKEQIISCRNNQEAVGDVVPTLSHRSMSSRKSIAMTRHIALLWHYDGSTYSGLAENIDCASDNSVEKHLFAALLKTCLVSTTDRKQCHYSRCGRTDKGVSSFGQVCALRVRSAFPERCMVRASAVDPLGSDDLTLMQEMNLPKNSIDEIECFVPPKVKQKHKQTDNHDASIDFVETEPTMYSTDLLVPTKIKEINYDLILNNVLPPSIRILGWCPVSDDFSARFSAVHRTYRYYFVRRNLNLHQMQQGLNKMIGRHDFRNLCKINLEEVDNFERLILDASIVECHPWSDYAGSLYGTDTSSLSKGSTSMDTSEDTTQFNRQLCFVQITGQAFLWHQIRHILAVLFMIGRGLEEPSVVDELLDVDKNPGKPSYNMAPDLPLVLHACGYNNLNIGRSVRNLWNVSCDLEMKWEDLALASERVRNGIDSLKTEALVRTDDLVTFINQILEDMRKKSKKNCDIEDLKNISLDDLAEQSIFVPWGLALTHIQKFCRIQPSPFTLKPCLHIPLMDRGRGTTYDEKVRSILSPSTHEKRRRDRFEENIIRKKRVVKEDNNFFEEKARQGGSCI